MKKLFVFIGIFFRWLWKFLNTGMTLLTNLFFLAVLVLFISLFIKPEVKVPQGAALVLAPAGDLVEKKTIVDPVSKIINDVAGFPLQEETLLQDVLDVIAAAGEDDRIKLIVLQLDDLTTGSLNQFRKIGQSLNAFKAKGKKVIAYGNHFSQGHYYLASYADEILLNPMGSVNLFGFGVFRLYMKKLIDRLAINFHVFKVGSFKSALEPFTRNNMSDEARAANQEWLARFWDRFCQDISSNRKFSPAFITQFINDLPSYLRKAGGDSSLMVMENHFVDSLKTKPEIEKYLISLVGKAEDDESFKQISYQDYLYTLTPSYTRHNTAKEKVAIIVAHGNIVYGETMPGQISSEGLGELLQEARTDSRTKAVVLRIDSGGGSAFASEQIRQELVQMQKSGKPVVVSMGALAASGAYWLSADADRIFASPFTLTGSIGIFGMLPTFENSLTKIGVASDGVGTTKMATAGNPTLALPPELRETMQLNVEEGYEKFINIVAQGRNMNIEQVKSIAQGRVWDGSKAKEIGLVDELGELDEAIAAAADLAGLKDYAPVYLRHTFPQDNGFLGYLSSWTQDTTKHLKALFIGDRKIIAKMKEQFDLLALRSDPANIYAHSLISPISISF